MKNSAKKLLEVSVFLGFATLVITYIVSTTSGRVASFIPIISEMPFNEPEASVFGTGLGISIFSFLILAQVFHKVFEPLAKEIGLVDRKGKPLNHILRYWEKQFSQIKPILMPGNRRYYTIINVLRKTFIFSN